MIFQECDLGWIYQNEKVIIFFGNKKSSQESLQKGFSEIQFRRLKQTHSDICVTSSETLVEADAHITNCLQTGLIISTADCMPILIFCPKTKSVAAVHAGWRGIVNQITKKTIQKMTSAGTDPSQLEVWIGPHVMQKSFEVEENVMSQIKNSSNEKSEEVFQKRNSKFYIDLMEVLKSQLNDLNVKIGTNNCLLIDTKTTSSVHSYRRDMAQSGRNLSFICLK